jgi:ribosome-binding protein aMBF1 (putative translation factor)
MIVIDREYGERVTRERCRRAWTRRDLARRVGCGWKTIEQVERGLVLDERFQRDIDLVFEKAPVLRRRYRG